MPRVLVVTYPWLPAFNAGVKHVASLVRCLPEAGWDPIILACDFTEGASAEDEPLHLTFPPTDDSATLRAVRGLPTVRVPFAARENRATRWRASLEAEATGAPSTKRRRVARAALEETYPLYGEYPDRFRGWVEPAVSAGVAAVRQYGIGAVVSVSSPDSVHIAGGRIARAADIPWIPLFGALGTFRIGDGDGRTIRQRLLHRSLTKRWLRHASRAAAVTPALRAYLESTYGLKAEVVGVPFDPDERRVPPRRVAGAPMRVVVLGRLEPDGERLGTLLAALDRLVGDDPSVADRLRVEFVGTGAESGLETLLAERAARRVCHVLPRVTPAEAVVVQREADLLVLLERGAAAGDPPAAARSPGTLAEALNARRPIVALAAEDGYVDQVLRETRAGRAVQSADALLEALGLALGELRDTGELTYRGDEGAVARHGAPEQARRLVSLLDVASAERFGSWQRV